MRRFDGLVRVAHSMGKLEEITRLPVSKIPERTWPSAKIMEGVGKVAMNAALVESYLRDFISEIIARNSSLGDLVFDDMRVSRMAALLPNAIHRSSDGLRAQAAEWQSAFAKANEQRNGVIHDVLGGQGPGADWVFRNSKKPLKSNEAKISAKDLEDLATRFWSLYWQLGNLRTAWASETRKGKS